MSTHAEAVDTARTKLLDLLDKLCKVEVPTARENVESIVDVANTLSYLRNDSPVNNDSPVITAANTAGTVTDTKPEQGPEPTPMTGNGAVAPDTRVNPPKDVSAIEAKNQDANGDDKGSDSGDESGTRQGDGLSFAVAVAESSVVETEGIPKGTTTRATGAVGDTSQGDPQPTARAAIGLALRAAGFPPMNHNNPIVDQVIARGITPETVLRHVIAARKAEKKNPVAYGLQTAVSEFDDPGVMFERLLDRLAANCKCPNCTARRAAAGAGPEVPVTISGDIAPTFRVITVPLGATPEEAIAKGMAEVLAEQLLHRNG